MSKPTILVIGSLNTDLITRTSRIPAPGETLTSQSFDTGSGGKGANQAVACARLSRRRDAVEQGDVLVRMVGAVGDDIFGHDLVGGLKQDGIDTNGVELKKGEKTGVSTIIVEEQTGENRILFSPNANYTLQPKNFTSLQEPLPDVIVLQLEIPLDTVLQVLKTAHEKGVQVVFNPAPAIPLPDEAYRCITHLIVNESEAAILSGNDSGQAPQPEAVHRIADHFRFLGVKNIIVTLGSRGVVSSGNSGMYEDLPAEKADVVDTTAAGDTFVGAYAVEVARHVGKGGEFDVAKAVKLANSAAAKTVEKRGAQAAIPWMDEHICLTIVSAGQELQDSYEIRPDTQKATHNNEDPSQNARTGVDYEPHPEKSLKVSPEHERIVKCIPRLYSESANDEDMRVYAENAVYDDPWSYCNRRYKIAGQWCGIPKIMASSKTLKTEIIEDAHNIIIYKQQQEYTPRILHFSKPVNSLISLTLDENGKVKYHKDQWNEKDSSHEGLGKVLKTLNGDQLTKITRPPEDL